MVSASKGSTSSSEVDSFLSVLQSQMIGMLYSKSLRLHSSARNEFGTGAIVNLQSNDAQKLWWLPLFMHVLWSAPLQVNPTGSLFCNSMLKHHWYLYRGYRLGPDFFTPLLTTFTYCNCMQIFFCVQGIAQDLLESTLRARNIEPHDNTSSGCRLWWCAFSWSESWASGLQLLA